MRKSHKKKVADKRRKQFIKRLRLFRSDFLRDYENQYKTSFDAVFDTRTSKTNWEDSEPLTMEKLIEVSNLLPKSDGFAYLNPYQQFISPKSKTSYFYELWVNFVDQYKIGNDTV